MSIYNYVYDLRIVGCLNLHLKQASAVKTDIQSEDGCDICNVEKGFSKTHTLVSKVEWNIARTAEVVGIVLIGYVLYQQYQKMK